MSKWELLAIIIALVAIIGTPLVAFGYQAYRESAAQPEGVPIRVFGFSRPLGDSAAGQQLFVSNCAVCHGQDARGQVGPNLHGVAVAGPTFLTAVVANPETVNNQATMPRIPLSRQEIADVVAYLMALPEVPDGVQIEVTPPASPAAPASSSEGAQSEAVSDIDQGAQLFQSKGCIACHGPGAQGTALAPSLVGKTAEEVRRQVRTPKKQMPPFSIAMLSDNELETIIQYIESLSR
ncbi:MAG: c-type cytochrome [Ardenticatenaceae bacterium]|nr:c-type cytochrome [Ardenticatenaceae bacterium]